MHWQFQSLFFEHQQQNLLNDMEQRQHRDGPQPGGPGGQGPPNPLPPPARNQSGNPNAGNAHEEPTPESPADRHLPPGLARDVPSRLTPETPARIGEEDATHGTFERRVTRPLSESDKGYWWRLQLTQQGIVTPLQAGKNYSRIPADPEAPNRLFMTNSDKQVATDDGKRVKLNQYLGGCLREYISLLVEILNIHSRRIDSSTAPLGLPQTGSGAETKARVVDTMTDSRSLREHINTFKWVWLTSKDHLQTLNCYRVPGPETWIDLARRANEDAIASATAPPTARSSATSARRWPGWRRRRSRPDKCDARRMR